jgi:hypothetical protein
MLLRALRKRAHDESLVIPGAAPPGSGTPSASTVPDAGVAAIAAPLEAGVATATVPDAGVAADAGPIDAGASDAALAPHDGGKPGKRAIKKPPAVEARAPSREQNKIKPVRDAGTP